MKRFIASALVALRSAEARKRQLDNPAFARILAATYSSLLEADDGVTMHAQSHTEPDKAPLVRPPPAQGAGRAIHKPRQPSTAPCVFVRRGNVWHIAYEGRQTVVSHVKGLTYLAELVRRPGHGFPALELSYIGNLPNGAHLSDHAVRLRDYDDAGQSNDFAAAPWEATDEKSLRAFERRIEELPAEIAEARQCGDREYGEKLEEDLAAIVTHMNRCKGLRGRVRVQNVEAERARKAVSKAIKAAMDLLAAHDPALGAHLAKYIHTGSHCTYDPGTAITWLTTL